MKRSLLFFSLFCLLQAVVAQDATSLLEKVKAKYGKVNDYAASARLKTNVSFLKTSEAAVKIYYRKPDQFRMQNESGVSFIPKGSVNVNMGNILTLQQYTAIDAGTGTVAGKPVRIIKVIPGGTDQELVLATLSIDEKNLLILRSESTTKNSGSYTLDMSYGKYASWGLPDKAVFSFNIKEYKLPKGVTLDYDNGTSGQKPAGGADTGEIELQYSSYQINKGVPDSVFK